VTQHQGAQFDWWYSLFGAGKTPTRSKNRCVLFVKVFTICNFYL